MIKSPKYQMLLITTVIQSNQVWINNVIWLHLAIYTVHKHVCHYKLFLQTTACY
jgi:hypothetical protein